MSSITRYFFSAIAAVLLSTPLLADNGTVLHFKGGSAAGEKTTVPVGATITFSTKGMQISSQQGVIEFDRFDAIEFSADRSQATPSQVNPGTVPEGTTTINIEFPAIDFNPVVDLGPGHTTPDPGPVVPPTPVTYDMSDVAVTVRNPDSYVYTGEPITPSYYVFRDNVALMEGRDFMTSLSDNIDAGTATITFTAVDGSSYKGSTSQTFTIAPCDLSGAAVSTEQSTYVYTGLAIEPVVTVVLDGKTLTKNVDYTVSYNKNVNAGTADITVRGKVNYTGSVESTFTIEKPVPEPDIVITIDGETIPADLSSDGSMAVYMGTNGSAWIMDYSAEIGDSMTLSVQPDNRNYFVSDVTFSGIIDYKEESMGDGTMTYKYAKPAGKLTIAIVFEEKQADGIAANAADGLHFTVIDRQTVRITGAEEAAQVSVFDARGQRVAADVQRSDTDIVVRLVAQPQGLYIIQVNNNTFKIYKK